MIGARGWLGGWLGGLLSLLLWLGWGLLGLPQVVWAQTAPSTPALEAVEPPLLDVVPSARDIPSEKVSQFVRAYLEVLKLMAEREPELRSAETELDSFEVERQIETEALSLIEATGLTQAEYLQLLGLANADPDFGERVTTQLQEIGGEA